MIITPTIVNHSQPALAVSSPSTTYTELKSALGPAAFKVIGMYYQAQTQNQLLNPVQYSHSDIEKGIELHSVTPLLDPYQRQIALDMPLKKDVLLDGKGQMAMQMQPSEMVTLIMYVDDQNPGALLNHLHLSNLDTVLEAMDHPMLFCGYKEKL